jgi:uncharacterized membrane protein
MESRVKLLGHPIHPMLIVLPLGLFVAAVIFDALYMWRANPTFAIVGFWNIGLGILGGLLAAVFGLLDWLGIPEGTRAKRIGLLHGGTMVVVVALFAFVLWARSEAVDPLLTAPLFSLEVLTLLMGAVGGWLGGELVDRLGVGVYDDANVSAPSSLSGVPVRRHAS